MSATPASRRIAAENNVELSDVEENIWSMELNTRTVAFGGEWEHAWRITKLNMKTGISIKDIPVTKVDYICRQMFNKLMEP